jgi:hypothetical protein
MERRSMDGLKLDKRLTGRKGWIRAEELARALAALPDVASKAETLSVQGGRPDAPRGGAESPATE